MSLMRTSSISASDQSATPLLNIPRPIDQPNGSDTMTLPPGPAGAVAESAAELGWQAGGGVEVAWLEGDHQSILRPPGVAALAREIAAGIDAALAGKGPARP